MSNYKEIITKAVIGKGKKTTKEHLTLQTKESIDNVLGCWVINHNFSGGVKNNNIIVDGTYDINIWYSYNNNTKTNVMINTFNYSDTMNVKLRENSKITNNSEIIVRSLNQPSVIDVTNKDNIIDIVVEKIMGVEVIGDSVVKVSVTDDYDDYDEIIDTDNIEINEEYLKN